MHRFFCVDKCPCVQWEKHFSVFYHESLGKECFCSLHPRFYSKVFTKCFLVRFKLLFKPVFCGIAHGYGNINKFQQPFHGIFTKIREQCFRNGPPG